MLPGPSDADKDCLDLSSLSFVDVLSMVIFRFCLYSIVCLLLTNCCVVYAHGIDVASLLL